MVKLKKKNTQSTFKVTLPPTLFGEIESRYLSHIKMC